MRVSTKRVLSIGFSLFFLIGAILVYSSFIRDAGTEVERLRALVASKTNLHSNQQQVVTQVKNLIAQFQNVAKLQETMSLAMPNGTQTVRALRQVEAIARTSGVQVTSVDFNIETLPKVKEGSFVARLGIIEVNVRAEGDYANLKQFVRLLETGVRVSNVREFDYVSRGTRAADSLTVTMDTFYQKP